MLLGEAEHGRHSHQSGKPQCPGLARGDRVKRLGGTGRGGGPCSGAALHSASDPTWNTEGSRVLGAEDEAQESVPKLHVKERGACLDLS